MLVVIDGTGEWFNKSYEKTMEGGFMKKIMRDSHHSPKEYFRGPSLTGIESGYIVAQVMNWIRQQLNNGATPELFIAGYSRGGSVAIEVAGEIANVASMASLLGDGPWCILNRNIRCMALFDAVDRSYLDTKVIPYNVTHAYHALRDPKAGSRRSFSNTGLEHEIPGNLETKTFFCTHGAMGGLPWKGDHPTEVIGQQITIPIIKKTFSYKYRSETVTVTDDSGVSVFDILRDEIGVSIGTEITRQLLTQDLDEKNGQEVWNWMFPRMLMTGMFSFSYSGGASGSW